MNKIKMHALLMTSGFLTTMMPVMAEEEKTTTLKTPTKQDATSFLKSGLGIASGILMVLGTIWTIMGLIKFFSALNDHNGPEQKNSIIQAISGVGIVVAAGWLGTLDISFG